MADIGGVAGDRLRSFLERYERLEEEKKAIADDQREVLAEAKGVGFDVKIIRHMLKLRKMDEAARQEQDSLIDAYRQALGMSEGQRLDREKEVETRFVAALVREGATVRDLADLFSISVGKAHTLMSAARSLFKLNEQLPHDPTTGEILPDPLDRPGTPTAPVAEPESPDAESADAKAAPNVNAGPAAASPAATSPANQDSAAPLTMPPIPDFLDRRRVAAE